jgi:aldehyde:ferredoxin oxidoreductase
MLRINLSEGKVTSEELAPDTRLEYIAARGVNAKLLWDEVKPGTDPLGPDNLLIFGAGVLNGTHIPCSGRTTVTTKSPATGLYFKCNVGGYWGAALRYAGWDNIVISGKASRPVYILIDADRAEIRDASHLWGLDVRQTNVALRQELNDPDIEVACIGPAGERQVLISSIMFSVYNAAARGGVGAVMGSKNLKAIVVRGDRGFSVAQPERFDELALKIKEEVLATAGSKGLYKYGTSGSMVNVNEMKALPAYNFKRSYSPLLPQIGGQALYDSGYVKRRLSCFACVVGCHRFTQLESGPYAGTYCGGPEFETIGALGAGCGVFDLQPIIKANEYCNIYGLDTISTGGVIQWLMECYERGVVSAQECGIEPLWGSGEAVVDLVRKIAYGEGIGKILGQGVKRAAREIGGDSWKWAIEVKGLEQSRVDTRSAKAYALAFAVNFRGPDHLHTETIGEFGFRPEGVALIEKLTGHKKYANPYLVDKRAEIVVWHEDCIAVTDSLGLCMFATAAIYGISPQRMAQVYSAFLGKEVEERELFKMGRRIVTLEKCFNVREGATRKDDRLPYRLMTEESADREGAINSAEELDRMLDEYYSLHGWDKKTSWPTEATLTNLGLTEVAAELRRLGKLPDGCNQ